MNEVTTKIDKHKKPGDRDASHQLEEFTAKAVEVAWSMLMVCPPMLIDTSETSYNPDTHNHQVYGVNKGIEESVESEDADYTVEYYKPVLYENYTKDVPTRKGWTGVRRMWTSL